MAKIEKDNLGYLGFDYQVRLMHQILVDNKFGNSIIDIVDPNYFKDDSLRIIAAIVKDAKKEEDIIPDLESLKIRIFHEMEEGSTRKYVLAQLQKVKDASSNDSFKTQDIAMKFCKQEELKKSLKEIQKIIDKGNLEDYEKCETILRKALEHGDNKDDGLDVFDGIENVLAEDFRKPIPTGITGLDNIMDGGLSKGELGVILAALGVGKTTMMTKIANTAMKEGYKVLQIFFEDNPKVIQRKHLSCWSGIDLNSLSLHKEELIQMCKEMEDGTRGKNGLLKLKKFPSDGTTIPEIRQYIRKLIAQGFRPDIVLLDYIDCVQASRQHADANIAEGTVMRQFESMLVEFDVAGWTAIQGNRSAISSDIVQADQMAGSIKKGQIGHFIVSIARTLDQRDNGTATMAILKSRFGKDGMIYQNIRFDNARIQIEMTENVKGRTHTEYKKDAEVQNQDRVNFVLQGAQKANEVHKNLINSPNDGEQK